MSDSDKTRDGLSPTVSPYGSWKSPITVDELFARFIGIGVVQIDGQDLYWTESRPDGRTVIVRRTGGGQTADVTSADYDVRTRVHEYGGGDYLAVDGVVDFANMTDQHFPGEQHGFLKAENNKRALEAELYFYSRVFGFELADEVEPIAIENLEVVGP